MRVVVSILLILFINITFASECGQFGMKFENEKCLCAAFTTPYNNGFSCVNGSGVCIPPSENFVGKNERYTLRLKTRSLRFEENNLVIHLEYPSIVTGLTDISVFTKEGKFISSLQEGIAKNSLGNWTHGIDSTGIGCQQVATWTVNWEELASRVETNVTGHYAFDITATTHIEREKTDLHIRTADVAPSILVDVVPITINLNQIVSTNDFHDRVEFALDYDVKLTYFLKKIHVDPTTLKVRAVLQHNISFPLSLKSRNLVVSINGNTIPAKSFEKENKQDCPAIKGSNCQAKTIILFHLPLQQNCTEYQLSINVELATKCGGTNDHTSKYLCYGLRKSLSTRHVLVKLPVKYNFCPKIETTEVSVKSFTLTQGSSNVPLLNDEILERDAELHGNILLDVVRIFKGSVFTMARISSIKLVESSSSGASYEIVDVSSQTNGQLADPNTIEISFSYFPSYQQITHHLQNWANGFYVQVTVDVSFYSPEGIEKRNANGEQIHTSVRIQIPHRNLPKYLKRDQVIASSSKMTLNQIAVKKSEEEHKLVQTKIKTDKISDDLRVIQKSNQDMVYLIIASVSACFVALLVAVVIIYKLKKRTEIIQN